MSIAQRKGSDLAKYVDKHVRSGSDLDDALEKAIKDTWPGTSEDKQADIYAALRESLDKYPSGMLRRVDLVHNIKKYNLGTIYQRKD